MGLPGATKTERPLSSTGRPLSGSATSPTLPTTATMRPLSPTSRDSPTAMGALSCGTLASTYLPARPGSATRTGVLTVDTSTMPLLKPPTVHDLGLPALIKADLVPLGVPGPQPPPTKKALQEEVRALRKRTRELELALRKAHADASKVLAYNTKTPRKQ